MCNKYYEVGNLAGLVGFILWVCGVQPQSSISTAIDYLDEANFYEPAGLTLESRPVVGLLSCILYLVDFYTLLFYCWTVGL